MRPGSATRSYGFVRYFPDKPVDAHDPACLCAYQWLTRLPLPRMVGEAIGLWQAIAASGGTTATEIAPAEVAAALHGSSLPAFDPIPRGGTVLAIIARRARKTVPDTPQCALNWVTFGTEAGQPRLGDVVCWLAEDGARVGLYVGEDDAAYHCLGASEGDRIDVHRAPKQQLRAVRRPLYEGVQYEANGIRLDRDGTRRG